MGAEARDLWPDDLALPAAPPPLAILREQAALLGRKTRDVVQAEVVTSTNEDDQVVNRFYLKVPRLGNYRYLLFQVVQSLPDYYPVKIRYGQAQESAESEEQLIEALRNIFSADSTRRVIGALIAQAKA